MKTSIITAVLVTVLIALVAGSASAHGRWGNHRNYYRPRPVVRYCPPVQVYAAPPVYSAPGYYGQAYCPPPPVMTRPVYYGRHHYRRHRW